MVPFDPDDIEEVAPAPSEPLPLFVTWELQQHEGQWLVVYHMHGWPLEIHPAYYSGKISDIPEGRIREVIRNPRFPAMLQAYRTFLELIPLEVKH